MKISLVLIAAVVCMGSINNVDDFIQGFVDTLEVDPSSVGDCGAQVLDIVQNLEVLQQDYINFIDKEKNSFTALLDGYKNFMLVVDSLPSVCPFSELSSWFSQLTTMDGLKKIGTRYLDNRAEISTLVQSLSQCNENYYDCGSNLAKIIKVLTNAELQSSFFPETEALRDPGFLED